MLKQHDLIVGNTRLHFLDALRGIAALLVVFYHLYGKLSESLDSVLPSIITNIFSYGYLGVTIFFVLSGFVIGGTLANATVSGSYLGRFILRRSIRIDLPYWVAIALAVLLLVVKDKILKLEVDYPNGLELFAHAIYLQDYLSIHPLSGVFWTLCLEIQFYLLFALSMFFFRKFNAQAHSFFLASTSILSLLIYCDVLPVDIPGFFLPYWCFFVVGVIVQRALMGERLGFFAFLLVAMLIGAFIREDGASLVTAIVVSVLIYALGVLGKLKNFLNVKPLQFLGAISYSLYLTHADIGWKAMSILDKIRPLSNSFQELALLYFVLGVIASILFASVFYLLVERPSLYLAKKISLKSNS